MDLLSPVVTAQGYDLEDLSVTAAGRRSLIRVTVDGDDGIDMDSVASVARAISEVLDDESTGAAAFSGPYVLEVSSPGVDRPLTEPRHWRRATGRLVSVPVGADAHQVTGRIVAASDGAQVVLEVAGHERTYPLSDLGPGRIQVEFSRPGQPDPAETDGESDDVDEGTEDSVDVEDIDGRHNEEEA